MEVSLHAPRPSAARAGAQGQTSLRKPLGPGSMLRIVRGAVGGLCALLLCVGAHAQPASIHPALFVARSHSATIYLFGTVHVRRPGAAWGGAEAVAALASSQALRTELEISPQADARAQATVGE